MSGARVTQGPTARRGLGLTVPTLRLVRKERVKEVCVKQWFLNDRFDVHVTMKRASADGEEVYGGCRHASVGFQRPIRPV